MSELAREFRLLREGGASEEAVEDVLAFVLLSSSLDNRSELSEGAAQLLGRFAKRVGADDGHSEAGERIRAWFVAHPLDETVVARLKAIVVDGKRVGAGDGRGALAKFLGDAQAQRVLDSGVRPPGTVPAGPLAAALTRSKK